MKAHLFLLSLMMFVVLNKAQSSRYKDCTIYRKIALGYGRNSFVNCIGYDVVSGQSDLVIMIDRSSKNAYRTAKEVVRSLLTEIKISYNATRIAVITFDKHVSVDIDFLRNPKPTNNKCEFNNLFQNKLPQNSGSGSNIRGALQMATNIFNDKHHNPALHNHRSRTNQVAILLSDGKGTHFAGNGDPKDASHEANQYVFFFV